MMRDEKKCQYCGAPMRLMQVDNRMRIWCIHCQKGIDYRRKKSGRRKLKSSTLQQTLDFGKKEARE